MGGVRAVGRERLQGLQKPVTEEMREVAQRFKTDELAAVRDFMRAAREVFEHHVRGPAAGGGSADDGGPPRRRRPAPGRCRNRAGS